MRFKTVTIMRDGTITCVDHDTDADLMADYAAKLNTKGLKYFGAYDTFEDSPGEARGWFLEIDQHG